MAKKIIYMVYQDCALCGDKGKIREAKIQKVTKKGWKVVKLSFATEMAKGFIHDAVLNHKIGSMPFYTDGEKFSYDINDIVAQPKKKSTKRKRVSKKAEVVEEEHGSISESE